MKKSKTYKGLLIQRKKDKEAEGYRLIISLIDINRDKSLDDLYEALDCRTIDIQERYIAGRLYDFIFDDEYLINGKSAEPSNCIALGTRKGRILEAIYGRLFICGQADQEGAERSLTDEDISHILEAGRIIAENQKTGEPYELIGYTFEDETKEEQPGTDEEATA